MIIKGQSRSGNTTYVGNVKDLRAVNDWVRSFLHIAHGVDEGERQYREYPLNKALDLWCKQSK